MLEIAPWENPNLSAPFATIEREIENRTRRFALWHWGNRIVWRDLSYPQLWWATLDVAASLADWEIAIENGRFGCAKTERYRFYGLADEIGLSPRTYFGARQLKGKEFYVILDEQDSGLWCAKGNDEWWLFYADKSARTKSQAINSINESFTIWHPDRAFTDVKSVVLKAFIPTLANTLSPALRQFFKAGTKAPAFLLLRDLSVWVVSKNSEVRGQKLNQYFDEQFRLLPTLLTYFALPEKSSFTLYDPQFMNPRIRYETEVEGIYWGINEDIPVSLSAHEILELQLRLRDALQPILTDAEIAEILDA